MTVLAKRENHEPILRVVLVTILLLFAVLYIRTIRQDLPYRYLVDEDYFYVSAMKIRDTGLQPNVLYPPLSPYLTSAISLLMDASSGGTQYAGNAAYSSPTILASRLSSTFFLLLACCFIYQIGKQLANPVAGLVAMALFGSDTQVFGFSLTIHGDPASYMFMGASVLFAIIALKHPNRRQALWWSSLLIFLGILGKYSIAPLAIFPAYLWLCRFVPSLRKQLLIIGGTVAVGFIGVILLRLFGQGAKLTFEHAGFLFLYNARLFDLETFQSSLTQILITMPGLLLGTAILLIAYLVLIRWRSLSIAQRSVIVLFFVMSVGVAFLMSFQVLRYRDLFVVPYALMILLAIGLDLLLAGLQSVWRVGLLVVIGSVIVFPEFMSDLQQSNQMRIPDTRVAASHWLEQYVARPSKLIKTHTPGDFLPHVNGYQGGYLGWEIVQSILEKTPEQWWTSGYLYAITDSRELSNSWFDSGTDKALYKGFTLAYQTPENYPGNGPRYAIFYTFPIETQTDIRVGNLAQIFGYNADFRLVCLGQRFPLRVYVRPLALTNIYYEMEISVRDPATGKILFTQRQAPGGFVQRPSNYWSINELIFDEHWVDTPLTVAPGTYDLAVSVYEPYHSVRLTMTDNTIGTTIGDSFSLGKIQFGNCATHF